jgi:hypothetical protein
LRLCAAEPQEVFRSSGTTLPGRSVHHHPYPDLYRQTIDEAFPRYCLPGPGRWPILSLIPSRDLVPDSSLSFMADHVLSRYGESSSRVAFGSEGVRVSEATRWAREQSWAGPPVVIMVTALALLEWLDYLAESEEKLTLPPQTVLFETGGFKGRKRVIRREQLVEMINDHLGVSPERIVREYGMTELTSQFYTQALTGGDPDLFVSLPWVRVRILDPVTLKRVPDGEPGLVAVFDLANLGSALHILTEDLGVEADGGFRLVGRASGAELRGCSLTAEALSAHYA